jgi:hypothetical protein
LHIFQMSLEVTFQKKLRDSGKNVRFSHSSASELAPAPEPQVVNTLCSNADSGSVIVSAPCRRTFRSYFVRSTYRSHVWRANGFQLGIRRPQHRASVVMRIVAYRYAMKDPIPSIEPDEYLARQRQARSLASAMGYDVLLAGSRAGSTHDHSADVLYPAGNYSSQPCVPDTRHKEFRIEEGRPGPWLWRRASRSANHPSG